MNYLKSFFCEDDGVETIEFIALIAVAAVLVGVIISIGSTMTSSAKSAQEDMSSALGNLKILDRVINNADKAFCKAAEGLICYSS